MSTTPTDPADPARAPGPADPARASGPADPARASGPAVTQVTIPARADGPDADLYRACVDLQNAVDAEAYGTTDLEYRPDEQLAEWHDDEHRPRVMLAVHDGDELVAMGTLETRRGSAAGTAWLDGVVHPRHRGRGTGRMLLERLEQLARERGAHQAHVYLATGPAPADPAGALVPPTGAGAVRADAAGVRFLQAHGWALQQVERCSVLALPADEAALGRVRQEARTAAGDAYRLHTWSGPAPERWLADLAVLATRMSTDAPSGGLDEPVDEHTPERVRAADELLAAGPRTMLSAAVEHVASGRLVGHSQLAVPEDPRRPAMQWNTLVLREHRGHRLGWLLKAANLDVLQERFPTVPAVYTYNAEENRPMLDVNEAVGFVPVAALGAWSRRL